MRNKIEISILFQSFVLMFLTSISSAFVGIYSHSDAILFDAFFAIVASVIKGLMIFTSYYSKKDPTERFQFGFWHFETLVLIVEGVFIFFLAVYAFYSGVYSLLFEEAKQIKFLVIIIYSLVCTIIFFSYYLYINKVNKTLKSNIVAADNISWLVDSIVIFVVLLSFSSSYLLKDSVYSNIASYIDSILLILLSIIMIPNVYKILKPSLSDLFGIAPKAINIMVRNKLNNLKEEKKFLEIEYFLQRSGSGYFLDIKILLDKSYNIVRIDELDEIRDYIYDDLYFLGKQKWITVIFTTDRKWLS